MKKLLKNGTIVDGNNAPAFQGSILIENGTIQEIIRGDPAHFEDGQIVDCEGKYISPGFIDCHSHNDWFAPLEKPQPYFEPFIRQGITSFIGGNCSFGIAGYPKELDYRKEISKGLFKWTGDLLWHSYDEFFGYMKDRCCLNMALLAGHGTLRAAMFGADTVKLSPEEIKRLCVVLDRAMEEGALGVSLGLQYQPSLFADSEEITAIANYVAKRKKMLTVHTRAYSVVSANYPMNPLGKPHNLIAVLEMLEIAKQTGVKLELSHLIMVGNRTFKTLNKILPAIEAAARDGVDVKFDVFATECGVTDITAPDPAWFMKLPKSQRLEPKTLRRLKFELELCYKLVGFSYADFLLAWCDYPGLEEFVGQTVTQIAEKLRLSPFETYVELLKRSQFTARIILSQYSNSEIIKRLARHPLSLFMTDAWLEDHGVQNPALVNGMLGFLLKTQEADGPSLEETVYKMTGATAQRFGLKNRGLIAKGYPADIAVFDLQDLKEQNISKRVSHVMINGRWAMEDGEIHELKGLGNVIKG